MQYKVVTRVATGIIGAMIASPISCWNTAVTNEKIRVIIVSCEFIQ